MNRDLHNYRENYEKGELLLASSAQNPIEQFSTWFKEVEAAGGIKEPNAMSLATVGANSFPKSRIVLLKAYNEKGFVFYTNYNSEKGKAIANNPKVCLSFFWPNLERQVIIQGVAQKLTEAASDTYFKSRPRASQLGAITSSQSDVITSREVLENRLTALSQEYADQDIPRPKHWGGFMVVPEIVEFWQGRPSRLHDRIRYRLDNEKWIKERLAP